MKFQRYELDPSPIVYAVVRQGGPNFAPGPNTPVSEWFTDPWDPAHEMPMQFMLPAPPAAGQIAGRTSPLPCRRRPEQGAVEELG